jgi:hypothetical protein
MRQSGPEPPSFLAKPFAPADLLVAVRRLLDARSEVG